jgi:hypothetical protein
MLSTWAASCCLFLSSTLAVAHVLVRPGSGGGDLQPSHWRRIVAPRLKKKARWRGVQRQAAAATRGGSTARLRLAGRGGVIPARRYCEGMQQRRPCC